VPTDASLLRDQRRKPPAAGTPRPAAMARLLTAGCVVLALPLVIMLAVVRFEFSWQPVYSYAVTAYHADEVTGVATPQLIAATEQIRIYFSNADQNLAVSVRQGGSEQPLFNEREIAHMRDVKALVQRFYALLDATALLVACSALTIVCLQRGGGRRLARAVVAGSVLTGAIVLGLGAASVLGFSQLFTEFHLLSFSNDLWELDPATDHLVQIFPLGYWFDVTMLAAVMSLALAVMLASVAGVYLLMSRRRP